LGGLLEKRGRFRILGNARNAFVAVPNGEGIEHFEDLVAGILASRFQGAAKLHALEEMLRGRQIILKSLTPSMLRDGSKVCIRGTAVVLTELA